MAPTFPGVSRISRRRESVINNAHNTQPQAATLVRSERSFGSANIVAIGMLCRNIEGIIWRISNKVINVSICDTAESVRGAGLRFLTNSNQFRAEQARIEITFNKTEYIEFPMAELTKIQKFALLFLRKKLMTDLFIVNRYYRINERRIIISASESMYQWRTAIVNLVADNLFINYDQQYITDTKASINLELRERFGE